MSELSGVTLVEQVSLEKGESDFERLVKYIRFAHSARTFRVPYTHSQLGPFLEWAEPSWRYVELKSLSGVAYSNVVPEFCLWERTNLLAVIRAIYCDAIEKMHRMNLQVGAFFIQDLRYHIDEAFERLSDAKYSSGRFGSLKLARDELRTKTNALNKPRTNERTEQLNLINSWAVIDARMQLLELEFIALEHTPDKESASRLRSRIFGRSLAKRDAWEGEAFDRITSRRADMYKLTSI